MGNGTHADKRTHGRSRETATAADAALRISALQRERISLAYNGDVSSTIRRRAAHNSSRRLSRHSYGDGDGEPESRTLLNSGGLAEGTLV